MHLLKIILTSIGIFCINVLWAQLSPVDSLKAVLAKSSDDTNKVNTLVALSRISVAANPELALQYAADATNLSSKIAFDRGRALALKSAGMVYYNQGKYLETLDYWTQSLNVFDSIEDKVGVANLLSNIGAVYSNQTEDAKALEYYFRSLRYAEEMGDKLRLATLYINIGNVYYHNPVNHPQALEYFIKSLPLSEGLDDNNTLGSACGNIGEIYLDRNQFDSALYYFQKSNKALNGTEDMPYALNNLGRFYAKQGNYVQALNYHRMSYQEAAKTDALLYMTQATLLSGDAFFQKGDYSASIDAYKKAQELALKISGKNIELKNSYHGLSQCYAKLKDYENAYKYDQLFSQVKDTLYNIDLDKKLASYQTSFELYKKQGQIDLLEKDKALQQLDINRQRIAKNALIAGMILVLTIIVIIYRDYRNKIKTNKLLDNQKAEIEDLLLNILPAEVAHELQRTGTATPRYYEKASVLFTDFKSFSKLADELSPQEVVSELNECFMAFDDIIGKYNLEKIKTIGDSYMCAGGLPREDDGHVLNIIKAGIEMQQYIEKWNKERAQRQLAPWEIRVGINTGPVVAGVVGKKKYAYDIWGGSVNVASRMESNGEPGKINISAATYELVKHKYACTYRGKIFAKNIGEVDMYFVEHEIS
ncbi:MAG: hypothetical protein RL172_1697 [Bacteroidota bacterium]|jgi:adenylate cyclase